MDINEIVQVTVQAAASTPTRRGFGTPLILGYHTRFADNVRTYRSLSAMVDDGFLVTDPVYQMAEAIFSQDPRPQKIKVGRPTNWGVNEHWTSVDITGMGSGDTVSFTVTLSDGTTADITQDWDTDQPTTEAALLAKIAAVDAALTVQSGVFAAGILSVEHTTVGDQVFYSDVTGPVEIEDVTSDLGYDTDLTTILNEDSDFYTVCIDVNSGVNIGDVAAWAAANKRLAFFAPQYQDPSNYTVGTTLFSSSARRAISLPTKKSRLNFSECGWVGECLPFDPGTQTWAFKTLTGIPVDAWTDTDRVNIEAYEGNYYVAVSGLNLTFYGTTHSGEYIDDIRGVDWLIARMQERLLALMANNRKVPITERGIAMAVAEVKGQLLAAEGGLLVPGSSVVFAPALEDIPDADKLSRILSGITFTATYAGAAHTFQINGTISA